MATIAQVPERPERPKRPFAAWHRWDRNFIAGLILYVWLGILLGFGGDIADHVLSHKPAFPLIVHVHAVVFVGWLVLFTVQAGLIRARRPELHRRLGYAMLGLAAFMLVIGPATALHMDRVHLQEPDADPTFVYIQLTDMLAFAVLTGAAVLLRNSASAHKRLMLLSLLYISDAGFARLLGPFVAPLIAGPYWSNFFGDYLASDLGMLAIAIYDLRTRGRLHPAYVAGLAFVTTVELGGTWAYVAGPLTRPLALWLIG